MTPVEKELRMFSLFAHRNLANDIVEGEGAYLDNLAGYFHRVNVPPPNSEAFKRVVILNSNTTEFANAILMLYRSSKRSSFVDCLV